MRGNNMRYDKDGINLNTKYILFSDENPLPKEEYGSINNLVDLRTIEVYTSMYNDFIIKRIFKTLLLKRKGININKIRYNKDKKYYEYVKSNGELIIFDTISNNLIDPPKELIKELESSKRYGKCHMRSVEICSSLEGSIVQTGTITMGNKRYLHTVIESKDKMGNPVILDWTKNLKIGKKEYIELFNFNILSSINSDEIFKDIQDIEQLPSICIKTYLMFKYELLRDLSKNKFLFEQNEIQKVKTK